MKKPLQLLSLTLCFSLLLCGCEQSQKFIYEKAVQSKRKAAHLIRKQIQVSPTQTIVYLENRADAEASSVDNTKRVVESKPLILMLHGFGGEKDNWLAMAKQLSPNYHLIIPDFPGHGESSSPMNGDYRFPAQVENLHHFLQKMQLKHINLIGHSMGGGVAMLYAHKYPQDMRTLSLISPAIFNPKEQSDFFKQLNNGKNPLIIKKKGDIDGFMKYLFVKQPRGFSWVKDYIESLKIERAPLNEKIFADLMKSKHHFNDINVTLKLLHQINMPIYLFWGDKDRVFNYDDTAIFQHSVPHLTVIQIKNAGHSSPMEAAKPIAKAYQQLLEKSNQKKQLAPVHNYSRFLQVEA